jgi:hypothetical protein
MRLADERFLPANRCHKGATKPSNFCKLTAIKQSSWGLTVRLIGGAF